MSIQPIRDRIAVEIIDETESAGGIVMTTGDQGNLAKGKVVAVGTERYFGGVADVLGVHVGDTVVFDKRYGYDVKDGDKKVRVIKEEQIEAIINEEKESK